MEIVHFAHEHPLILKELEENSYRCNACGLYVLLSPCYICTIQGCDFYIHQACAQLPPQSHHYFDHEGDPVVKHALAFIEKPRDENCLCGECGELCKNFTYHCSECEFFLHPLCKFPLDIQIKHISHPQHPIVVVCKEALLLCDVCGRKHEGYFYSCHRCNFWIHQDCALLPSIIKVEKHHHGLSLIYSGASLLDFRITSRKCLICSKITIRKFGVYYCFLCRRMAHVDCATSSQRKDLGTILQRDTFLSSSMRKLVKKRAIQESDSTNMLENYHTHSLLLTDEITQESVCNACIQPISPPYYKCNAQSKCNFFLHKFCADLPFSFTDPNFDLFVCILTSPRSDEFFSLFRCASCQKYCNGFGYRYRGLTRVIDLECAFAPVVIKHDSHKQHPLIIIYTGFADFLTTSCCGKKNRRTYHCSVCNFSIHDDCAILPKTIIHKFDKHPLTLTFTSSSQHVFDNTVHFCEFCEEDIDCKYWFYHCVQCDQSFHVDCIPSVGEYSKIKFGGTVKVPCHNDHPLTLVRMLNVGSQTCGYCQDIIEGFKDGMALYCADCDFWIHFKCGDRSYGRIVSHPYLNLSELESD